MAALLDVGLEAVESIWRVQALARVLVCCWAVWSTPYRCRSEVLRACTAELETSSATMRASACSRSRETG
jgi:hypothetical protein